MDEYEECWFRTFRNLIPKAQRQAICGAANFVFAVLYRLFNFWRRFLFAWITGDWEVWRFWRNVVLRGLGVEGLISRARPACSSLMVSIGGLCGELPVRIHFPGSRSIVHFCIGFEEHSFGRNLFPRRIKNLWSLCSSWSWLVVSCCLLFSRFIQAFWHVLNISDTFSSSKFFRVYHWCGEQLWGFPELGSPAFSSASCTQPYCQADTIWSSKRTRQYH